MAITVVLALVLSLVLALAGPVAASPIYNVSGTWNVNVEYLSVNYPETLILTQASGNITGVSINSIPPVFSSAFTITGGSVSGNAIVFHASYDPNNLQTMTFTGIIANSGSMSGTWADDIGFLGRTGNWVAAKNTGVVTVSGNVVAPTITVTPPSAIDFGLLKLGSNLKASSGNGGLAIDLGSANSVTWQITAQDISSNQGHLAISPSVYLADELTIGKDTSTLYYDANGLGTYGILTYSGGYNGSTWTGDALSFAAGQTVLATDPAGNNFYTTITFTATILSSN